MLRLADRNISQETRACAQSIAQELGLNDTTALVLALRGVTTPEEARSFLYPDAAGLCDPFELPDMDACVRRLGEAIESGEQIVIFGDYDADGTAAAAILYGYLSSAGANVSCMFPDRNAQGYGLSADAIEEIAETEAQVIVTVDCGVTNVKEISLANECGLEVIVIDHHECPQTLPEAVAVVDPKRSDSRSPYKEFCGAGLAFKTVCALADTDTALRYIDIAALATVADVVPLMGENRIIAHLGIQVMRTRPSQGIAALCRAQGIDPAALTSRKVAYTLAPKINAASRMDTATVAFGLFSCDSRSDADALAARLIELNEKRRAEEQRIAMQLLADFDEDSLRSDYVLFFAGNDFNPGVIGIVAATMSERYRRPAAVLARCGDDYVASVRSVTGVNMYELLARFRDMFIKFGGHSQAAGFTIAADKLPELHEKLNAAIKEAYPPQVFVREATYDIEAAPADIDDKLINELSLFEPCGHGNPQPQFLFTDVQMKSASFVGKDNRQHLKFTLARDNYEIPAIAFGYAAKYRFTASSCSCVASVERDTYSQKPSANVDAVLPCDFRTQLTDYVRSNGFGIALDFFAFLSEMSDNCGQPGLDECIEFMQREPFGTAVVFDTLCGARELYRDVRLSKLFADSCLDVCWERTSLPYNAVMSSGDAARRHGYSRICRVERGCSLSEHRFKNEYIETVKHGFVPRDGLLKVWSAIAKGCSDPQRLASAAGIDIYGAAFAVSVFAELGLLELSDSGIITPCKSSGVKRELASSSLYVLCDGIAKS